MVGKTAAAAKALLEHNIGTITRAGEARGDLWGIELENELDENFQIPAGLGYKWEISGFEHHADGSLRGRGFEFTSGAWKLDKLKENLKTLCATNIGLPWSYSRRTSTHIHINFSDKKIEDLLKFLALYWITEPVLFTLVKPSRWNNAFCNTTESTRIAFLTGLSERYSFEELKEENQFKYESLNLATLFRTGTAECRIFHSSWDHKEICVWLDYLDALLQSSKKFKTLEAIRQKFIIENPKDFFRDIIGDQVLKVILKNDVDLPKLLRTGFRTAAPVFKMTQVLSDIGRFLREEEIKEAQRVKIIEEALKRELDILKYIEKVEDVAPQVQIRPQQNLDEMLDWFVADEHHPDALEPDVPAPLRFRVNAAGRLEQI